MIELTPTEYIKCSASCFWDKSYEKKSWQARLDLFSEIPEIGSPEICNADTPVRLIKALKAYEKASKGQETGYLVQVDASSSVIQIMAMLTDCQKSWDLCGGNPEILDAYTYLYSQMDTAQELSRDDLKQAIMPSFYNSTAVPKAIFGSDLTKYYKLMETETPGAWDLREALQDVWSSVKGHNYSWVMPDGFFCDITTKTKQEETFSFLGENRKITKEVEGRPEVYKGLAPNVIHSCDAFILREIVSLASIPKTVKLRLYQKTKQKLSVGRFSKVKEAESYVKFKRYVDLYKKTGFLSVKAMLSYNPNNTTKEEADIMLPYLEYVSQFSKFDVSTIHDCFETHPNYTNEVKKMYNYMLLLLKRSHLLDSIVSDILGETVHYEKVFNPIDEDTIINSSYSLA